MSGDYQQRDNSGNLFKNQSKKSDNAPDYSGGAVIQGKPLRISAWIKDGKNGEFMSLAFSPKDQQNGNQQQRQASKPPVDEDTPF